MRARAFGAGARTLPAGKICKIAPNNRKSAMIDKTGRNGGPVSIRQAGAIQQFLARTKTPFGGLSERD